MSLEGQHIGRYRFLRLLGSGGMGDVYLAEDARIGQQVAIKVIRAGVTPYPDVDAAKEVARLFQREATAIVKLDHPNILALFDYGEEQIGNLIFTYLVMPYRQEGSLADWLRRRKAKLLSPQNVAHIVRQAAEALQHAHNHQIIHQDVKPSNFLIRQREENPTRPDLFLTDFGIARLTTATSGQSQAVRGTPTYMAPEQWEGDPVPATDQYALAVMAYELLAGRPPFLGAPGRMMYQHINTEPPPPRTFNPRLSSAIDTVLLHALAKRPEMRFPSIIAFADALRQAIQGMQSVKAPLLITPSNLPLASMTGLGSRPVSVVPVTQSNFSPVNRGLMQQNSVNDLTTQQNISNGTQGEAASILRENELVDLPTKPETAVPMHELPISAAPRHSAGRWPMLVLALVLLALVLVGGGIAYVVPVLLSTILGSSRAATLTIAPASIDLKNTYTISAVTGALAASKYQVMARLLSSITPGQTQVAKATGMATTSGTHATGILTITNFNALSPLTLQAGLIVANSGSIPIQMMLDATVTVPPANAGSGSSVATVPAHVVQVGTIGNISHIDDFYQIGGQSGTAGWSIANFTPFTGGTGPQAYIAVQQSNIDGVANALIKANTPSPQQVLQAQIHANERFVGTPQCKPKVTSDHKAGDEAKSVTVTVRFICIGEVYDQAEALSLASKLLNEQAASDPGPGYALEGNIATALRDTTVVDAKQGTIKLTINAEGVWVFQFSNAQKQALAKLVAGKKKQDVQAILLNQTGVKQADIQVSGGDGNTLPTNPSRITIVVQGVPEAQGKTTQMAAVETPALARATQLGRIVKCILMWA